MRLKTNKIKHIVRQALLEDKAFSDITTKLLISPKYKAKAKIWVSQDCVLCGLDVARFVFKALDPSLNVSSKYKDSQQIKTGSVVLEVTGRAGAILSAERVALNFLSHLCGIATLTRQIVNTVKKSKVKILDTRKTMPLLRCLEKYAVLCGGGYNHRMSLNDFVLIKDNHKKVLKIRNENSFKELITKARLGAKNKRKVEIEVENISEFKNALKANPDIIMLDNMSIAEIKKCVAWKDRLNPSLRLESSGGINLRNVRDIAGSGVDFISLGSLTQSPPTIDFSLEVV